MIMPFPTVSVLIATCNRPEQLSRAIQSVLEQTYQEFEIIVVDDGLEKRAEDVVAQFVDERIIYIKHEKNKGCSAAKNTGIREARGIYIAILDDDDKWLSEKLEKQIAALEKSPEDVGFCFTGATEEFSDRTAHTQVPEGVDDYTEFALRTFSGMIDSAMVYKKEVFDTVGGLDESYPTHTGAEFVIRVAKQFRGVGINEPLVWRDMRGEYTHMGSSIHNRIKGREMLLAQYGEEFKEYPHFLAKHLEQLGRFYRDVGEYRNAQSTFFKAFRLQPRIKRLLLTIFPFARNATK